jgi:hypothetical protein
MNSCTILIPHVNTPHLVIGAINQIKKLTKNVDYEVVVADQSDEAIHKSLLEKYKNDERIKVIKLNRVDAGYPIDVVSRSSTKEYFCTLDADAFPIHPNWLYLPIQLLKEFNLSFVGQDTGLGHHPAYAFDGEFCHLNNYFRVSKTETAKLLSETAGFCRVQHQHRTGLKYEDVNWKLDHADNGVLAQWYSDKKSLGGKVGLALNKILGMTNEFGVYGMCIDDLVFHFVFGYHPDTINDAKKSLGNQYLDLENRIKSTGLTEEIIEELIASLKDHHPYETRVYSMGNGGRADTLNAQNEIYKRIEELKKI